MRLRDLLLPARCPVCRAAGAAPCERCAATLPAAPALPPPPGVDACHALTAYAGGGRELVAALKFRGERGHLTWAAARLADLVTEPVDVVTWIPATTSHRRRRGVDPAEVVARAVAAQLGVPSRRFLRRGRGPSQRARTAAERRRGPSLVALGRAPRAVLVVDDVVTTGGSASAAARALRGAGASAVVVAALARTPPRGHVT